jgi:hypothetical protein
MTSWSWLYLHGAFGQKSDMRSAAPERSIDVSLSADLEGYELDSNDAGHNQSVDVSYFAQTPDGQRRNRGTNRYAIAKRSVFISTG